MLYFFLPNIDAGYYLTFISGALFIIAGRTLHRNLRPFICAPQSPFLIIAPLYKPLGMLFTSLTINFIVVPFMLWDLNTSIQVWRSVAFLPLLWLIGVVVVFEMCGLGSVIGRIGRSWGYKDKKT